MRFFTLLLFAIVGLGACRKTVTIELKDTKFSADIRRIIPQALIDTLRKKGMPVYEGLNPPDLEGIYFVAPLVLVSPYGPQDGLKPGHRFLDYKYRLYAQDKKALTIKVDLKSTNTPPSETATGVGGYLAGNGNFFSLFIETNGIANGIQNRQIKTISGEITPAGIKTYYESLLVADKQGDEANTKVIPVGTGRVIRDQDGLSERVATFSLPPGLGQQYPPLGSASVGIH